MLFQILFAAKFRFYWQKIQQNHSFVHLIRLSLPCFQCDLTCQYQYCLHMVLVLFYNYIPLIFHLSISQRVSIRDFQDQPSHKLCSSMIKQIIQRNKKETVIMKQENKKNIIYFCKISIHFTCMDRTFSQVFSHVEIMYDASCTLKCICNADK